MDLGGLGVEFEEFGMVALIGLLLIPGVAWISKGRSTGAIVGRSLVVGAAIVAAASLEITIDRTAEALVPGDAA